MNKEESDRMHKYMTSVFRMTTKVDEAQLDAWFESVKWFTPSQVRAAIIRANQDSETNRPSLKQIIYYARLAKLDQGREDRDILVQNAQNCRLCHNRGWVAVEFYREIIPNIRDYELFCFRCTCQRGAIIEAKIPALDLRMLQGRVQRDYDRAWVMDDKKPRPGMSEAVARKYVDIRKAVEPQK